MREAFLAYIFSLTLLFTFPALAEELTEAELAREIEALQVQMQSLERQLGSLKARAATIAPQVSTPTASRIPSSQVKFTPSGFVEAAGTYRSTKHPFVHPSHGLTWQSRLSLLAEDKLGNDTDLTAYIEGEFLGAGPNSLLGGEKAYRPRLRQMHIATDNHATDFHFLAGHAWSLATLHSQGLIPRKENIPLAINNQFVPGFTWTRNWQVRAVKDIDEALWLGLSLESPEVTREKILPTSPDAAGTLPDIVAKMAYDHSSGHYELYALGRVFRDRAIHGNETEIGGGAGAGAIIPVIPDMVSLEASFLVGKGIGKYGSSQFPDVRITPQGYVHPLTAAQGLLGIRAKPEEDWSLYAYGGMEHISSDTLHLTPASSPLHPASVWQITGGAWHDLYKGAYGALKLGLQAAYTRRNLEGGSQDGFYSNENLFIMGVRYYPF